MNLLKVCFLEIFGKLKIVKIVFDLNDFGNNKGLIINELISEINFHEFYFNIEIGLKVFISSLF